MQQAKNQQRNLIDLAIAVFLLSISALLSANIFVIYSAIAHNDEACKQATIAAAEAAREGEDQSGIVYAAQHELSRCGVGGFFIRGPELKYFTHDFSAGKHRLKVKTSVEAILPAPALIAGLGGRSAVVFERTYTMDLIVPSEKSSEDIDSQRSNANDSSKAH